MSEKHQPGEMLWLACNDCWEKVPSPCLTAAEMCHSGFILQVSLTCSPNGGEEHAICLGRKLLMLMSSTPTTTNTNKTQNTRSIVCKGSVWGIWQNRSIKRLQISGFQLLSVISFKFIQSASTLEGQLIFIWLQIYKLQVRALRLFGQTMATELKLTMTTTKA